MNSSYLTEAFKSLEILDEEQFDLMDKTSIEKADKFIEDDKDELDVVDVIDMDFDDVEDVEVEDKFTTHIGDVICDCPVCHSKIYKSKEDITIDEDEEYANVGEECPYCYSADGFKIVGQVAPFEPDSEEEDEEKEVRVTVDDKETEVEESLNCKTRNINESKDVDLTEYQKWVDYDMKKYHKISDITMNKIKKAGLSVVKDQYGEYEVIADRSDSDKKNESLKKSKTEGCHGTRRKNKSIKGKKLTEKKWDYTLKTGSALRDAIEDDDPAGVQLALHDCYTELNDHGLIDDEDYAEWTDDLMMAESDDEDEMDFQLSQFYDLCDNLGVWIPLSESIGKKKVHEGFEKIEVETDNERIKIETEPREETIIPVESEVKTEISDEQETVEDEESEDEIDLDVDEFDEDQFDKIGESYLKKVYENIDSYRTISASTNSKQDKLIIEGIIKFKSGNQKKTKFIFESHDATKSGKVRFIGENCQISKGKKSFTLKGSLNNGKFISESLNYNYRAKDSLGKSVRLYGTVKA